MKSTILCFSLILSHSLFAQNTIDIFTLSGRYGLPQNYDPVLAQKGQESGALVNLKVPVVFNKKTIWYNNLTYTYSSVSNGLDFGPKLMNPIGLHGFILQTGLVQKVSENNAFQLLFVPRFMTDFIAPSAKQWQLGAIALFEHKYSDKLTMRFGAMYNQELGGPLLVPLIDINWQINRRWSVVGLAPIYLKINYKVNERFTAGISHFGLITSYYLSDPNFIGNYMERTSIDLCLFGRWKMHGNLYLEGRVGYALGRTYAQYAADEKIDLRVSILKFGDNRGEPLNPVFNDGAIAELRLVYSLPIPQ